MILLSLCQKINHLTPTTQNDIINQQQEKLILEQYITHAVNAQKIFFQQWEVETNSSLQHHEMYSKIQFLNLSTTVKVLFAFHQ